MRSSIKLLAETESNDMRGASIGTKYGLQPVQYLKEIIDGAKEQHFFVQFAKVVKAQEGARDVVIPKRTKYEGDTGMTWNYAGTDVGGGTSHATGDYSTAGGVGPYANTIADISWTTMDSLSSVYGTPYPVIIGYAIRKFDLRTNAVNILQACKEELSYAIGDRLDRRCAITLGNATMADSGTTGSQVIYGGDATSDAELSDGDVITTDLVAKAAKYLKLRTGYYRGTASGAYGTEALNSVTKNPWMPTAGEPFVFFIGPAQEETFRTDSQFVNAAEYGSNRVVMNGEIGEYLGIKIVVTNNVENVAASSAGPDTQTVAATSMTRCVMLKAKVAFAVIWGREPQIKVYEWDNRDQVRVRLLCDYDIKVIHDDAIVFVDVSDV